MSCTPMESLISWGIHVILRSVLGLIMKRTRIMLSWLLSRRSSWTPTPNTWTNMILLSRACMMHGIGAVT